MRANDSPLIANDPLGLENLPRDLSMNLCAVVKHELAVEELDQLGLLRPEFWLDVAMEVPTDVI